MRKYFLVLSIVFIFQFTAQSFVRQTFSWSSETSVNSSNSSALTESTSFSMINRDSSFVRDTSYHHAWKRATIWSACLPGAGQIYNEMGYRKVQNKRHRAWWKVPIIYGGLGATAYFFYQNYSLASDLKEEWLFRDSNGGATLNPEYNTWTTDELINGKTLNGITSAGYDQAASRRDLLVAGFLAVWGLNVVEALVDGHFVTFDVSEDLSFQWSPVILPLNTPGVHLQFNLN